MKKANSTKRALLASVISMMLCCAMLVGSTFAWFTDTVTSGKNKIVAGNLDVELEYSVDGINWTEVDENTNMFKEGALWEPGYTEVVYLQVKNAGSLALKYQFGINDAAGKVEGISVEGNKIDLADFIKFGVVKADAVFADRDAARAAVKDTAGLISAGYSSDVRKLAAGDTSDMLALVVYMPEEVGNAANYRGEDIPQIYLGLNLKATQAMEEEDSFGNDYDKYAMLSMKEAIIQGAADSNVAIVEEIKAIMEERGEEVPENINELVYFDEGLKQVHDDLLDADVLATTLHFEDNTQNYVGVTYTAVKALIGKAVNDQASTIKSIKIATADERVLNGEPFADNSGDWVETDLKAVMDSLENRTLAGALLAAQEYGLPVTFVYMDGTSQTFRMDFDIKWTANND